MRFGGIWNSGETSNKAVMDMPRTEKMNGLCDVVGFGFGGTCECGCEMEAKLQCVVEKHNAFLSTCIDY